MSFPLRIITLYLFFLDDNSLTYSGQKNLNASWSLFSMATFISWAYIWSQSRFLGSKRVSLGFGASLREHPESKKTINNKRTYICTLK